MDSHYKQEISSYGKKDAAIALGFYLYVCVVLYVFAALFRMDLPINTTVQHIISTSLVVIPCLTLVMRSKQGLASIGLHTKNLRPALYTGLIFSVTALLFRDVLPGLVGNWEMQLFSHIIFTLFMAITVSFLEDTLFTGYIQTRIYGLIKNEIAAVLVVAFLFAFSHIAAFAGLFGFSVAFSTLISFNMIFWMTMHVIWNLMFRRYFSLFPIMMLHVLWNFGDSGIFIRDETSLAFAFTANAFYVLLLVTAIWLIVERYRNRKNSIEV